MPRSTRVDAAINIADLRLLAKRRLPKAFFDFIDGGAEDEATVRANRDQFLRWAFVGQSPCDVSQRNYETKLFGDTYGAPLVVSATGMASLHRGLADILLARGAHAMNVPFTLATVSTVSIEDTAAAVRGPLWFQLYILRDRRFTFSLIDRARVSGFKVLVVTVDCPVPGQRERDPRNGLTVPMRLSWRNSLDFARKTGWLIDMLRHGEPKPENFRETSGGLNGRALSTYMQTQLDPSVGWSDIDAVRRRWPGPLVIKGVLSPQDADAAVAHGADGIVVSNHGGRQLDGAVPPLEVLPEIVDAVGDRCTVLCDSGFRRGTDIAKALALGAKAVGLGRATLYGLAAGGEAGVIKALTLLRDELDRVMALTGCSRVEQFNRHRLRDLSHLRLQS